MDVVFFDPGDPERDLRSRRPDVSWDVKNQAFVHRWYEKKFGYAVPPLRSSERGFAAGPATATGVGVRPLANGGLRVVAPLGLEDLFGLVLRRNPRRVTPGLFREWVVEKDFERKWPKVRIVHESTGPVSA